MSTERSIQKLLITDLMQKKHHKLVIPNIYLFNWESDLLSIDSDNCIHEFEIKCSKWDYQNDFKKEEKHKLLNDLTDTGAIPNYFWYVATEDFVNGIVLPDYAGLIVVVKRGMQGYLSFKKKAPVLHAETMDSETWEKLAIKLCYKLI